MISNTVNITSVKINMMNPWAAFCPIFCRYLVSGGVHNGASEACIAINDDAPRCTYIYLPRPHLWYLHIRVQHGWKTRGTFHGRVR